MKYVSKTLVLSILMLTLGWNAFSQVSYGGLPPSFKAHKNLPSATKVEVNLNVAKLKADNLLSKQESNNPPCIAKAIPVSYNMENSGLWITLADGREMWQLRLKAQGALAILLSYSNFYIPECGQLFIYSADKSHVIGAFTSSTHPHADAFFHRNGRR